MNPQKTEWVADSSALLAFLWDEPGADQVASVIGSMATSAVNYAEVVDVMSRRELRAEPIDRNIAALQLRIVPLEATTARAAGLLRAETKPLGLSLGDCVVLTLAVEMDLPVLTCDRAWARLDLPVPVVVIR